MALTPIHRPLPRVSSAAIPSTVTTCSLLQFLHSTFHLRVHSVMEHHRGLIKHTMNIIYPPPAIQTRPTSDLLAASNPSRSPNSFRGPMQRVQLGNLPGVVSRPPGKSARMISTYTPGIVTRQIVPAGPVGAVPIYVEGVER